MSAAEMSVAEVSEVSVTSTKDFQDGIEPGLARANEMLRKVRSTWIEEQQVHRCASRRGTNVGTTTTEEEYENED